MIPKAIYELYQNTIKKNRLKPGLPLVFMESLHVLNNSLDNLNKNLEENDFYNLSQEFDANVLHLVKKEGPFLMNTVIALKILMKVHLAKTDFLIHQLIVELVIKIMNNKFLSFEKYL